MKLYVAHPGPKLIMAPCPLGQGAAATQNCSEKEADLCAQAREVRFGLLSGEVETRHVVEVPGIESGQGRAVLDGARGDEEVDLAAAGRPDRPIQPGREGGDSAVHGHGIGYGEEPLLIFHLLGGARPSEPLVEDR